nr:MAG TPA: major capsid protein [Caudoviricetes sp.]
MNLKALIEKRNALVEEINKVFETAEAETRALTSEEQELFTSKTQELKDLDATIKMAKEARSLEDMDVPKEERQAVETVEADDKAEVRAFETFIRENRAGEMKIGDNGAVVPTTIANQILDTVKQIAPLYGLATKFNVKGKLEFPVAKNAITTAYSEEFTALTSSAVGFDKRTLDGFLVGALSKVSVSLINNSQFDIVNYVINKVAESIALFLEKEIISGDGTTKMTGVLTDTLVKNVETAGDVPTADEFIAVQVEVPQAYQANCAWLVSNKTLLAMRQMKDTNGRYFLQNDLTNGFGYTFLGKPVMVSDQMTDANVVYGDFSGYYVNIHENINIKVLNEKYADEHAVGVVAWLEVDGKVMEEGKLVKTVKKTSEMSSRSKKAVTE